MLANELIDRVLPRRRIGKARQKQLVERARDIGAGRQRRDLLRIVGDVAYRSDTPDRQRRAVVENKVVRRAEKTVLVARLEIRSLVRAPFDAGAVNRPAGGFE